MKKVVYHIKGFDCANCAIKSEKHLNKDSRILEATIDFTGEKLFVTYKDAPMSEKELINKIKEVESDKIEITKYSAIKKEKVKIFTLKFWVTLVRILISLILILLARFAFIDYIYLSTILYSIALVIILYDVAWKVFYNIIKLTNPLDEYLLILIASIGAFLMVFLGEPEYFEGVMVVLLWQIGQLFEDIATKKSKEAISSAIDLRADTAHKIVEDRVIMIKPSELVVGDRIIVRVGEIIPVDGIIIEGSGSLDMSSLTGESLPVSIKVGQNVLSGSILTSGSITLRVEKVFSDSSISKILELVQNSGERKTKTEKFITKFARIYTPVVLVLAIFVSVLTGVTNLYDWAKAIYLGLEILLIGCPCAIVISVPLAYFAAIGLSSKNGIIVKGGSYIDALTKIGVLFVDKTGTLTYGNFVVQKKVTINVDKSSFDEYLLAAESRSSHPIARAICAHQDVAQFALEQAEYEEVAGLGVKTLFRNQLILAGNAELLQKYNVVFNEVDECGTVIYLAVDQKYLGYVVVGDTIREKAKQLVTSLTGMGVKVVLLSGDTKRNVEHVSREVGIADYHYKLLPIDKTKIVAKEIANQQSKKKSKLVAFAGDGINDTPSIIRADIGIAMGGIGSDIAVDNADIVIMQDHPLKIYHAIRIGKIARFISIFNIVFALAIKLIVFFLSIFNISNMTIAILADTGLTIVLVIISLSILFYKVK